ncbi:MAG: P-II family nitrogen regulator [Desulfovibrionaceae bacterium]|nr:P-II family nitrogen regulator [Desulfovibrionaceae bacterium]
MSANSFLITCIIERGRADEVMKVARQAGARGGTIMPARGTSTSEDKKFLGIPVMPAEKEVLLIVTDHDQVEVILDAIYKMPIFSKPGSSVVYSTPLHSFHTSSGN